jgi:hypothetical protein
LRPLPSADERSGFSADRGLKMAAFLAPTVGREAERFFGGLLVAAGKPAFERTEVRRGRALVRRRVAVPGYSVETFRPPTHAQMKRRETVRTVTVPRWIAAVGIVVVTVYAVNVVAPGEASKADAWLKSKVPSLPSVKPPAWNASNPLGWANVPAWFHG